MGHTLRIGIIGLGEVASVHWEAYHNEPWIRVVSVCDLKQGPVEDFCEKTGARGFTDITDMLEFGLIDLALILTPAASHRVICEQVAKAGIHVFSEKPIALTRSDARAMLAACDEAQVKFFYGSCYRYLPAVVKAKELIARGDLGQVKLMQEQLVGGLGPEKYHDYGASHYPIGMPGGPGLGLVDHGIHLVDIMPWICASPIVEVYGSGARSGAGPTVEYMIMQLENGARAHLLYYTASWFTNLPSEAHISAGLSWGADGSVNPPGTLDPHPGSLSVYGDQASLRLYHYANALYLFNGTGMHKIALEGRIAPGHFVTQLEDCARSIFDHQTPIVDGHDGLRALDAVLKVYENKESTHV